MHGKHTQLQSILYVKAYKLTLLMSYFFYKRERVTLEYPSLYEVILWKLSQTHRKQWLNCILNFVFKFTKLCII